MTRFWSSYQRYHHHFDRRKLAGIPISISSSSFLAVLFVNTFLIGAYDAQQQTAQKQLDDWCASRFGPSKQSCLDLLARWCSGNAASNGGNNVQKPQICDAYAATNGGGGGAVPASLPVAAAAQQVQRPQPQPQPQSDVGGAGPRAKKADPSTVNNVNELFSKLAAGKQQLEDTIKVISDLWPKKSKDTKSKAARTELSQNDPRKYWHGDVDLTQTQAQSLIAWAREQDNQAQLENSAGATRGKRKVGKPPAFELWTINPIPYQFHRSVPVPTRSVIKQAIQMWESNTCRRWVEGGGGGRERLEFVNGDGCSSFIGHAGGTQEINLATPGCDLPGIAAHEIGHSLGFFHEQSRPDQGDNVRINYKNIRLDVTSNFVPMKVRDVDYYGEPYDFGSVMHYDGLTRGFTKNENDHSILTIDPLYQNTIGQRVGPSFVDYKQINAAYCTGKCGGLNPGGCQFGGYADPNNCAGPCKCPTGFGGWKCETVARSTIPNCGGVLQAGKDPQFFTTPNYPNAYPSGGDCYWMLKAPDQRSRVYVEFVEKFSFPCEDTCSSAYAEVKRGPQFERTGYRFCCDDPPDGQPLISEGPLMVIALSTHGEARSGFKVRYYTDMGTGVVPPPIATPRPGGGTKRPPLPPPSRPSGGGGTGSKPSGPGPGPVQPPGCNCGNWGQWSACSQQCGGCGYIRRQRPCNRNDCLDIEKKHCNFQRCKDDTNVMWQNNEFNFLFDGCCVGMIAQGGTCGGLNTAFTQVISSFLPDTSSGKR